MKFFDRFRENRRFFQKAQAAMEFLMTYGWAILVVIVVIGVLAYSGVLGGAFFLPEKCVISTGSGLFCQDFSASPGRIILKLKNVLSDQVEITEASVSQDGNLCNLTNSPVVIPADSSTNLILSSGPTCLDLTMPGEKLKGDISITFTRKSLSKIATGETITQVGEAAIGGADYNICYNADKNCLCFGLDIVFGPGYKDACCSTHDLCCDPCYP